MLTIIFTFDKFSYYLIGSKVISFTDQSYIKCLLTKKDVKARLIFFFFFFFF
ncbi:hypothetical protein MA16_Dca019281 [Dendrobium catenatum]|uniref:Reverse transcriptase RNase H-like domain-containing protein n=1 Tax=Dendrobium catenatum TaxID=906689 RepID=A0A2I0X3W8_9ASPA|nr:hypothetical protein MA16_Dca019281 [Dendrobium catenatum]